MFVPDGPPPKWGQKRREREREERTGRRRKALKSYRAMGLRLSGRWGIVPSARLFLPFPPFSSQEVHLGGGILSENKFGKELQVFFMTPFSLEEREKFKYLKLRIN
jgi:hypothetical protein